MTDKISEAHAADARDDYNEAYRLWKDIVQTDPQGVHLLKYGWAAFHIEEWQESQNALERALETKPSARILMQMLGHLWARRTDKEGEEHFQIAEGWLLKALERGKTAPILSVLGSVYVELENIPRAMECFEDALKVDEKYEEAMCNLACLLSTDDPSRAICLLEAAVEIDPGYARAFQNLGKQYQRQKDSVRAEAQFRRCIEIDAEDYWSYLYLANSLAVQRRHDEAEVLFDYAIQLHPENEEVAEIFAKFLDRRGKQEKAARLRKGMSSSGISQGI